VTEGNAIDCLAFFRYLMADVATASSFGSATGALSKWATNIDDPLVTAIGDFPKRGIVVCSESPPYDLQTHRFFSGVLCQPGHGN
jgi:hypothetical protein